MEDLARFYEQYPMWALVVDTALKLGFILAIIFTLAPVLVWAERRQSAMIQDRIGPVRAGIPLPPKLTRILGNYQAAAAVAGAAFVAMLAAFLFEETIAAAYLTADQIAAYQAGEALPLDYTLLFRVGPVAGFVVTFIGAFAAYYVHKTRGNITVAGLLHPAADALKFIFKEDFVPPKGDRLLHALAPILMVVTAIAAFAVVPFADTVYVQYLGEALPADGFIEGPAVPMQVASLNVGILFVFAVAGTGVIGAALAGYASDNKYALLGGLRAASQMVSYEVTLGLTIVPCFMVYGTLLLEDMVQWQQMHYWGLFVFPTLTLSAIMFLAASIAETKRIPFDLPEGESEIVAGYFTEYSGMKFGMFFTAEFAEVILLAAVFATLFLGGYDVPFLHRGGFEVGDWLLPIPHWGVIVIQILSFVIKLIVLIWLQLQIRWTLPRFRYDQLMSVCWKLILPASLLNIMLTGVILLVFLD